MSLVLKMAQKWLCPDSKNGTLAKNKKKPPAAEKMTLPLTMTKSETAHHSDSAYKNKRIGLLTADEMRACIAEINYYEQRQQDLGLDKPEKSRNQICKKHGIDPSTLSKWMTGKVVRIGCQLGRWRRGRVLNAGEFQLTQYLLRVDCHNQVTQ